MKKIQKQFPLLDFSVLFIGVIVFCAWQKPADNNYSNKGGIYNNQNDTVPKNNYNKDNFNTDAFDKAMKQLDENMANLDVQMKNLNINLNKQVQASLSNINIAEIEKQTEASLKQVDWNKIQQQVNNSLQQAQKEIARIEFTKMNNELKDIQKKFQSEEFKSQFNSEKLHKQIDDAMSKAKDGIEKAKEKLQELKNFTNELEADGLIDKKKNYTIEWKNGDLYINDKMQPKTISDKYRKYEHDFDGKIKMESDGAEHF